MPPPLLHAGAILAQSFRYQAQVGPVVQSGYHRIELPPDVLGRLQDGLADLRLYDGHKREVPYLLTRQTGVDATAFVAFGEVRRTGIPNVKTTIVVKRPDRQPIQAIGVELKNTNVGKKAALSGSNDGNTWYAIDDAVWLGRNSNSATTTTRQTIPFPLSDYPYFQLTVNDSTSAPLNILRIGSYGPRSALARYTPILNLRFTQRDSSDRYTYVLLDRPSPARLDRLTIRVGSPAQFRRQAAFGHNFTEQIVRNRRSRPILRQAFDPLLPFTLSSVGDTIIQLPGILTDKLCLRIDNGDNPPLQIRRIEAAQITTYLTASLQADSTYQLQFGNGNTPTEAPVYDLAYFKNKLPDTLPAASVGPIRSAQETGRSDIIKRNTYLVWGATIAVLLVLGTMTYRLMKETATHSRT